MGIPAGMRLFHVSERADIGRFEPRRMGGPDERALVWAVDEPHLVNYLLPRECPRVCFRAAGSTLPEDRMRLLTGNSGPVVAIQSDWLERAAQTALHVYEFPHDSFTCEDVNAGYFVSSEPVVHLCVNCVSEPLHAIEAAGATLRVVQDLKELAAEVSRSTLSFSCIRMRNLDPGGRLDGRRFLQGA